MDGFLWSNGLFLREKDVRNGEIQTVNSSILFLSPPNERHEIWVFELPLLMNIYYCLFNWCDMVLEDTYKSSGPSAPLSSATSSSYSSAANRSQSDICKLLTTIKILLGSDCEILVMMYYRKDVLSTSSSLHKDKDECIISKLSFVMSKQLKFSLSTNKN